MLYNNRFKLKQMIGLALVLFILVSPLSSVNYVTTYVAEAKTKTIKVTTKVKKVDSNGNLVLKIKRKALYNAGFSKKDIVKIRIGNRKTDYIMPLYAKNMIWGKTYLDVHSSTIKITRQDRSFAVREHEKSAKGKKVVITMYKKKGYGWTSPTDDISDYGNNQAKFANFRMVKTGRLGNNKLFRSHSPVSESSPYGGRVIPVNTLMQKYGIASVLTLNLDPDDIENKINKESSAYYVSLMDNGGVSAIKLNGKYIDSTEFRQGLSKHIRFMLDHDGPYLVHCAIGRDRTGFTIALLEALMGATYDEIAEDYEITYRNYNLVKKGSAMDTYLKTSIDDTIQEWTGSSGKYVKPQKVDLEAAAKRYLKKILKFTDTDIEKLQEKLS